MISTPRNSLNYILSKFNGKKLVSCSSLFQAHYLASYFFPLGNVPEEFEIHGVRRFIAFFVGRVTFEFIFYLLRPEKPSIVAQTDIR